MNVKSILLVEDNEVDKLLFKEYLRGSSMKDWKLNCVENLKDALEAIRNYSFDIVVLDLSLPDSEGLDGLIRVRQVNQFLPVLILTGFGESQMGMKAIQFGAQDYMQKDGLNEYLLEKSLIYAMERARLNKQDQQETIDQLRETQKALLSKQEELQQALIREQELSEMRSQFISGASHQFRTPLAVIKSNTELLVSLMDSENPRFKRMQERINDEMERIINIMDDLLKISAFKSADRDSVPELVDLPQLAKRTLVEFIQRNSGDCWGINVDSTEEKLEVAMDVNMFKEALENTFIYVFRYQNVKKQPRLSIEHNGDKVRLLISSTGVIIPIDQLKHLFQPFFQPDNLPDYHGSALGLFIAKHHVESLNGEMSVCESTEGEVGFELAFSL